ncbi:MAG: terminase small subunit [Deltaproteobacteria bacterium]|nr:terminase small subunit [Deltaproteobacteria bacterium]
MAPKRKAKVKANLTAKREKFCQGIVSGMSQSDAYRDAYSTKNTTKTIWENASRLADNSKVKARIAELRQPVAKKAQITLESHLDDLMKLRNLAVNEKQVSAAISAEIARGKAAGVHIEKSQIDLNNLNPMVIIRYGNSSK